MGWGYPVRVFAVVNLSPESFYRGSVARDLDSLMEMVESAVEAGADAVDVGGMSSAPYVDGWVPAEEETRRVIPAVRSISGSFDVPVIVDTWRSEVAEAALGAGAAAVNDVTGLRGDERMADLIAESGASAVLCASGPVVDPSDPILEVRRLLRESLSVARGAGIDPERILIDPAIGFFRDAGVPWYEWDAKILAGLRRLSILERPVEVGVSRKSFIGEIAGAPTPEGRLPGSLAAAAAAVINGASAVRTHDPAETVQAVRVAEAIRDPPRECSYGLVSCSELVGLTADDAMELMGEMGVHPVGSRIMARKSTFRLLLLRNVAAPVASVVKQEMLASGGDCATPTQTIVSGSGGRVRILIMGTDAQISRLISKLKADVSHGMGLRSDFEDVLMVISEILGG